MTDFWNGTGNWTDGTHWSAGAPPGSTDNAEIVSGSATFTPNSLDRKIGSLQVDTGTNLTVNASPFVIQTKDVFVHVASLLTLQNGLTAFGNITTENGGVIAGKGILNATSYTIANYGTIDANVNGAVLEVTDNGKPIVNNGTMLAELGGTLKLDHLANFSNGILTNGNYEVGDPVGNGASQILINSHDAITTLAASTHVSLFGANSELRTATQSLEQSLTTVNGTLELSYGFHAQAFDASHAIHLVAGNLDVFGATFTSPSLQIDQASNLYAGGVFTSTNHTSEASAELFGPVVNNGSIFAIGEARLTDVAPALIIHGPVTGSGSMTLLYDATLELGGRVAASETIVFDNTKGQSETLQIDATTVNAHGTTGFAAGISGFMIGDVIDLKMLANATGYAFNGSDLTVHLKNHADAVLNLAGSGLAASTQFLLTADAAKTGTDIQIKAPASAAINSAAATTTTTTVATSSTIVTTFDPAADTFVFDKTASSTAKTLLDRAYDPNLPGQHEVANTSTASLDQPHEIDATSLVGAAVADLFHTLARHHEMLYGI